MKCPAAVGRHRDGTLSFMPPPGEDPATGRPRPASRVRCTVTVWYDAAFFLDDIVLSNSKVDG